MVMPHRPAAAKRYSCFRESRTRFPGHTIHRARYPMIKRINRISTGEKDLKSTLVEIKVVPQIRMVTNAARWPAGVFS